MPDELAGEAPPPICPICGWPLAPVGPVGEYWCAACDHLWSGLDLLLEDEAP